MLYKIRGENDANGGKLYKIGAENGNRLAEGAFENGASRYSQDRRPSTRMQPNGPIIRLVEDSKGIVQNISA